MSDELSEQTHFKHIPRLIEVPKQSEATCFEKVLNLSSLSEY